MRKTVAMIAVSLGFIAGASADEVWSTQIGDVIYENDLESGFAVLSYPLDAEGMRGRSYIEDLAGVYTGRRSYSGIWIEPDSEGETTCTYGIENPETGELASNWGRIEMIFVDPDFPGSWVIKRGFCFEDPSYYLIGKPVVAGDSDAE